MHRFYLPPAECRGPLLTLTGRETRHALQVLRVRCGERVSVLDGAGRELHCEVRATDRKSVEVSVLEEVSMPPLPFQLTLLQAIPKGKLIEEIIQKATELGTHRIVPIVSERAIARFDDHSASAKAAKWRLVAIEAVKQCGNAWLPQVDAPTALSQFLARQEKFELSLVASLQGDGCLAGEQIRHFAARHGRMPASVSVWVGPEGDFTPAELEAIRTWGAMPITLGRFVLRCETAAVYCLSILSHELQLASN